MTILKRSNSLTPSPLHCDAPRLKQMFCCRIIMLRFPACSANFNLQQIETSYINAAQDASPTLTQLILPSLLRCIFSYRPNQDFYCLKPIILRFSPDINGHSFFMIILKAKYFPVYCLFYTACPVLPLISRDRKRYNSGSFV
jgi:hypothetical protein